MGQSCGGRSTGGSGKLGPGGGPPPSPWPLGLPCATGSHLIQLDPRAPLQGRLGPWLSHSSLSSFLVCPAQCLGGLGSSSPYRAGRCLVWSLPLWHLGRQRRAPAGSGMPPGAALVLLPARVLSCWPHPPPPLCVLSGSPWGRTMHVAPEPGGSRKLFVSGLTYLLPPWSCPVTKYSLGVWVPGLVQSTVPCASCWHSLAQPWLGGSLAAWVQT